MKKKESSIFKFFLISPQHLKTLLERNSNNIQSKISLILSDSDMGKSEKLFKINNLLSHRPAPQTEYVEKSTETFQHMDDVENKNKNDDEEEKEEKINDRNFFKLSKNKFSSTDETVFHPQESSSPRKKKTNYVEEIFSNSQWNETSKNNRSIQDLDESELDISREKQSFLQHIADARQQDVNELDIRDLSVGDMTDDKSFVKITDRKSGEIFYVQKPKSFNKYRLETTGGPLRTRQQSTLLNTVPSRSKNNFNTRWKAYGDLLFRKKANQSLKKVKKKTEIKKNKGSRQIRK